MIPAVTGTTGITPLCGGVELCARKARLSDISDILRLINGFAQQGIMLPRSEFEMAENIRDFTVIETGGRAAGCGALHFYTAQLAEIRSLAVSPESQGSGAGRKLMDALELEARQFGLTGVFAFTYIPRFFEKLGFRTIERGELPLKAWKDCLRCPKFQCCDETAVVKFFDPPAHAASDPPSCGLTTSPGNVSPGLVTLAPASNRR